MKFIQYIRNLFPRFVIVDDRTFADRNYRQVLAKNLNTGKYRKVWPTEVGGFKRFYWTKFFIVK